MAIVLGAIADDFTGATDLANTLVKNGMRTIQTIGAPAPGLDLGDADAVVVALKSRSNPADEAVRMSLGALDALKARGCPRFFFKYCSTFDSTDAGNIGPVGDALLDALGAKIAIYCPAFPVNGRSIYMGHLFVGDVLLSDSSMRHHPITPMTDASLVRTLQRQTKRKVGLVPLKTVSAGPEAIRTKLGELAADAVAHAIVDAVNDDDLAAIGEAVADAPLLTGGSGVALGLPAAYRKRRLLPARNDAATAPKAVGSAAVIAGSCSAATNAQVEAFRVGGGEVFAIDPTTLFEARDVAAEALAWAHPRLGATPVLIASTAPPAQVAETQKRFGMEESAKRIEATMAAIARGLVDRGVGKLVVAGGETSGAAVGALGVEALAIGPEIDPGVPWTQTLGGKRPLALALKSGNFGALDFFAKAFARLS